MRVRPSWIGLSAKRKPPRPPLPLPQRQLLHNFTHLLRQHVPAIIPRPQCLCLTPLHTLLRLPLGHLRLPPTSKRKRHQLTVHSIDRTHMRINHHILIRSKTSAIRQRPRLRFLLYLTLAIFSLHHCPRAPQVHLYPSKYPYHLSILYRRWG